MDIPQTPDLPHGNRGSTVYGEPHQTPDGATVITVARVRAGMASPVGVCVIRGESARFLPTVEPDRVAVIAVSTGLVAAAITALALLRRPPWPDLRATR